jgi:hypothetical protein
MKKINKDKCQGIESPITRGEKIKVVITSLEFKKR